MRRGNAKAETVITSISWQPFHQNPKCDRLIAGSSDGAAHVWDTTRGVVKHSLGHRKFVSTVIWGGQQCIYTASRDCTISLWDSSTFTRLAEIRDHAHWVNASALQIYVDMST
ncbi:WD domain, G-beta repeat [Carpediemonas membranifera]|uniref:WD domain, G-beta repeat n=1 Tax=Carpediemonas membranifera TaxID=201153 RepID=A0A8J6AUU2_9EUKA|nr:WD domain, G-beta repeat [Carpediemonas membranifera]|eukprot:KAG9394738.1 WD domain, G-beta repeat [Carpediemonas membranifera]